MFKSIELCSLGSWNFYVPDNKYWGLGKVLERSRKGLDYNTDTNYKHASNSTESLHTLLWPNITLNFYAVGIIYKWAQQQCRINLPNNPKHIHKGTQWQTKTYVCIHISHPQFHFYKVFLYFVNSNYNSVQ